MIFEDIDSSMTRISQNIGVNSGLSAALGSSSIWEAIKSFTINNEKYKLNLEVVQELSESASSWADFALKSGHQDKNDRVVEQSKLKSDL